MNWTAHAAIIAMLLENGTAEGREIARRELAHMGQLLDDSSVPFSEVNSLSSKECKPDFPLYPC